MPSNDYAKIRLAEIALELKKTKRNTTKYEKLMREIDSLIFDPEDLANRQDFDYDEGLLEGESVEERNARLDAEWEQNREN